MASAACGGDDDVGDDTSDDTGDDTSDDTGDDTGDDTSDDGGDDGSVACDEDNGSITLPDGFCASVFAEGLGAARHVTVSPSGDVFVAVADSDAGAGGVVALRDTDADGIADETETFGKIGGNGIAWSDDALFFAENGAILRYELPDGDLLPAVEPDVVVSGLPADGDHPSKTVVLDTAGNLFVNIASASNACQEVNRELESPGVDPCPELDTRAGVWAFPADGIDLLQEDGERVGEGLRNMNALAVDPVTDVLWGAQNGRDQLYDNWPEIYEPEDEIALPGEAVYAIGDDAEYGWPYCYYDSFQGTNVLAPEYGGDGMIVDECADVAEPSYVFPAHWAPLGMTFYTGDQFPAAYLDGMFVAFHGSRFEPEATGDLPGYNVAFLPFDGDAPAEGDFEVFADDFAGDARPLPDAAEHRPVGLAEGPDGELYISDDYGGRVWRVIYVGE
jgi:glucose/arabinose dehydrogenase